MELTKEQEKKLEQIAMAYSIEIMERGGLDTRDNDREDFPEISIWSIRSIIKEAYKAGVKDGKEAYRAGMKDGKKEFDIGDPKR